MMKKIFTACALVAGLLSAPMSAHAAIINFDDLGIGDDGVLAMEEVTPYKSLDWGFAWYAAKNSDDVFGDVARSGTQYLFNGGGVNDFANSLSITSANPFTFLGAWFAAPAILEDSAANAITVSAYDSLDQLIGTTGPVAIGAAFTEVSASFSDVSRLSITRNAGSFGIFIMDDLNIRLEGEQDGEVPEPASWAMLGLGLALMGVARRARARAK